MFKIVHMTFASLAIIAFLIRAVLLFWTSKNQPKTASLSLATASVDGETAIPVTAKPKSAGRIMLVAMQHLAFTLLIITGMVLLYQNQFVVQPWFYGKIILFLVILSAMAKAFGKRDISMGQRKAGAMVAGIAFAGLMTLVIWKPDFSDQATQTTAESVPGQVAALSSPAACTQQCSHH